MNGPITRMNIVDALQDDGFKIHEVPNAEEALKALDVQLGVDCLLTDVDLGAGLNGLRLASEVRTRYPSVEIVVVSGQLRSMPPGVPDGRFFIKPYDPAAIAKTLREMVLARRNRARGNSRCS
ncbi:response regulator [Devosia sp. 1566]|uniref:response regulator n=1 Tax=Devosia sp. 1566 TaxID=2499144 RepID=UPI000FDA0A9C|nr:response regulator [Devosia sp. 1566]